MDLVHMGTLRLRTVHLRTVRLRIVHLRTVHLRTVHLRTIRLRTIHLRTVRLRAVRLWTIRLLAIRLRTVRPSSSSETVRLTGLHLFSHFLSLPAALGSLFPCAEEYSCNDRSGEDSIREQIDDNIEQHLHYIEEPAYGAGDHCPGPLKERLLLHRVIRVLNDLCQRNIDRGIGDVGVHSGQSRTGLIELCLHLRETFFYRDHFLDRLRLLHHLKKTRFLLLKRFNIDGLVIVDPGDILNVHAAVRDLSACSLDPGKEVLVLFGGDPDDHERGECAPSLGAFVLVPLIIAVCTRLALDDPVILADHLMDLLRCLCKSERLNLHAACIDELLF